MERTKDVIYIRWNNFHSTLTDGFQNLLRNETMVDVTLAAEGKFVKAHRLVLSVCSPYFKTLLEAHPYPHPILIMTDVKYNVLSNLLQFMYNGQAGVKHQNIPSFLKLASKLQVKGLAGDNLKTAENLLQCRRVLKLARVRKRKMIYSLSLRDRRMRSLLNIKNKKKINRQRNKRSLWHMEPVKNPKQDVVCEDSDSRDSYETNILKESVIAHKHDDDSSEKYINSSPSILVDKMDNELTQEASIAENNLQFGIRDYIKNVTIEDLETDVHRGLFCNRQNSLDNNGQRNFQSDTQHVPLNHEKNKLYTEMECTSQSQRHVDNVSPNDVQNTSQNHEEDDLQSDSQKVVESGVQNVIPNDEQYPVRSEKQNEFLRALSLMQRKTQCDLTNDVQYPLQRVVQHPPQKDLENASPVDADRPVQRDLPNYSPNDVPYPLQRDVQNASPYDGQYSVQKDVANSSPIDVQYQQNGVRDVLPNDAQYSPQRHVPNCSPNDVQYPLQGHVPNYTPNDVEYSPQRNVENASPIGVQSNVVNYPPNDVQYSLQSECENNLESGIDNVSNSDVDSECAVNGDGNNVKESEVQFLTQTKAQIGSEKAAHSDTQNVLQNDLQKDSHKNVHCALESGAEIVKQDEVQSFPRTGRRITYFKKDRPKNVQYALSSSTKIVEPSQIHSISHSEGESEVEYISQKHPEKDPHKNVQCDQRSDSSDIEVIEVHFDIEVLTPSDSQKNLQCAVKRGAQIDEQNDVRFVSQIQAQVDSQNSEQNDVQDLEENVQYGSKRGADEVVEQSGIQFASQPEENIGERNVLRNKLRKKTNEQDTVDNGANNEEEIEVQFDSQAAQGDAQNTLQSDPQDSLKNIQYAPRCSVVAERNEIQSVSQSEEKSDERNISQNDVQKDSHESVQYDRQSDVNIDEEDDEVQFISETKAQPGAQNALQNDAQDSQKNIQYSPKRRFLDVEQCEVQSVSQIQTKMSSRNSLQNEPQDSRENVQHAPKRRVNDDEQSEVQSASQTQAQMDSQNPAQNDLQDSQENAQFAPKRRAIEVEQSEVQPASQSEQKSDERKSLRNDLRKYRHKNAKCAKNSDANIIEKSKVQPVSQPQAEISSQNDAQNSQKNVQYEPKRHAINLERIEATFASQMEVKTDTGGRKQSVTQDDLEIHAKKNSQMKTLDPERRAKSVELSKVPSVSQPEEKIDDRNAVLNDLRMYRHKNVQNDRPSRSKNIDESQAQSISKTKAVTDLVKTKRDELENVLQNIRLDVQQKKKKKEEEDSIVQAEAPKSPQINVCMNMLQKFAQEVARSKTPKILQSHVEKDFQGNVQNTFESDPTTVVGSRVSQNYMKKPQTEKLPVSKMYVKNFEGSGIRCISPEDLQKFIEIDVENDLDSNVNIIKPSRKQFELQKDQQTIVQDTVNNVKGNILQSKLPSISQNKLQGRLQTRVQSRLENVAKNGAQGTSSKGIQMRSQSNVPNVLQSDVTNTTQEGIYYMLSNNVPSNSQSHVQYGVRDGQGIVPNLEQFNLQKNSQITPPPGQQIQYSIKYDPRKVPLSVLQGLLLNPLQNIPPKPVHYALISDLKNNNNAPNVLNNNLQQKPQTSVQYVLTSRNDVNNIPSSGLQSVLQNPLQKIPQTSVQYVLSNRSDANNIPSSASQNCAPEISQTPVQYILRSDVKSNPPIVLQNVEQNHVQNDQQKSVQYILKNDVNNTGGTEGQSVSQNDVQSNFSNIIRTDIIKIPSSGITYITLPGTVQGNTQNFVQYPLRSDVRNTAPYCGIHYFLSNPLQMDPQRRVHYTVGTDVSNTASNGVQFVVRNDAQMNPESNVPNVIRTDLINVPPGVEYVLPNKVQISPQSHVQHAVSSEVRNVGPSELPKVAQSHVENMAQGQDPRYALICDVKNLAHSGLQYHFRIGPREDETQYTVISNVNHVHENLPSPDKPNVVKTNAQSYLNGGGRNSCDGEDIQEVIYENDDRFGQVIGDIEVETVSEKRSETEASIIEKVARPIIIANLQGKPHDAPDPKPETVNANVVHDDDDVDDSHEHLNDIQRRSKSSRTSFIWKYFIKYPSSATCRLCGKTFKGFRPHTSIECHLKTRHYHQYLDFTRSREEQRKQIAKDQFDHLFSRFYGLTRTDTSKP